MTVATGTAIREWMFNRRRGAVLRGLVLLGAAIACFPCAAKIHDRSAEIEQTEVVEWRLGFDASDQTR